MKRKVKRAAKATTGRVAKRSTKGRIVRKSAVKAKAARAEKTAAKPSRPASDNVMDVLVEAGAKALGLPLDPTWTAAVIFNLRLILQHGARVDEFALPDDAEPPPIYRA